MLDLHCPVCNKEFRSKLSRAGHTSHCRGRKYTSWNKGLTKEDHAGLASASMKMSARYADGSLTTTISPEGRKKLSETAKKNKLGGYRPHPNRGQFYNGVWLDSKWELRVAISLDENNVRWERPSEGFIWNDKGQRYFPDFYLPEFDVYLDPKNSYLQVKDKEKIEQVQLRHGIKVLVLGEQQLTWDKINACMA